MIAKRIDPLTEAEAVAIILNTEISERQFKKMYDAMVELYFLNAENF